MKTSLFLMLSPHNRNSCLHGPPSCTVFVLNATATADNALKICTSHRIPARTNQACGENRIGRLWLPHPSLPPMAMKSLTQSTSTCVPAPLSKAHQLEVRLILSKTCTHTYTYARFINLHHTLMCPQLHIVQSPTHPTQA